jgi:hypothetical protein
LKKDEEKDVTNANNLADTLSWLQFSEVAEPVPDGMSKPEWIASLFEARTKEGLCLL